MITRIPHYQRHQDWWCTFCWHSCLDSQPVEPEIGHFDMRMGESVKKDENVGAEWQEIRMFHKKLFKSDSYLHCGDHLSWKPPNKHAGVSCRHLNVNHNSPSSSPSPSTPSPPLRTSSRPTSSSSAYLRQRWGACSHWKMRVQWRALSGQPWWPCILQCGNRRWPDWEEGVSEQLGETVIWRGERFRCFQT